MFITVKIAFKFISKSVVHTFELQIIAGHPEWTWQFWKWITVCDRTVFIQMVKVNLGVGHLWLYSSLVRQNNNLANCWLQLPIHDMENNKQVLLTAPTVHYTLPFCIAPWQCIWLVRLLLDVILYLSLMTCESAENLCVRGQWDRWAQLCSYRATPLSYRVIPNVR